MSQGIIALLAALAAPAGQSADVDGPGRVCVKYSMFDVAAGERWQVGMLGIEGAVFTLHRPGGDVAYYESENRVIPARPAKLVLVRSDARFERRREGRTVFYVVWGRTDFSRDHDAAIVVLRSASFRGTAADRKVYERVHITPPDRSQCIRSYLYGWDDIDLGPAQK